MFRRIQFLIYQEAEEGEKGPRKKNVGTGEVGCVHSFFRPSLSRPWNMNHLFQNLHVPLSPLKGAALQPLLWILVDLGET